MVSNHLNVKLNGFKSSKHFQSNTFMPNVYTNVDLHGHDTLHLMI